MKWNASAVCHVGKRRSENQDNLLFCGEIRDAQASAPWSRNAMHMASSSSALFAVCDGMGGTRNGGVAAQLAVQSLQQANTGEASAFSALFAQANKAVCEHNAKTGDDSGATCVLAAIGETEVNIANVGDSRAYFYHDKTLAQCTEDHTEYERRLKMGFTPEALEKMPQVHHQLTQHLGVPAHNMQIEPFYAPAIAWERGDAVLLCSDGLSGMVPQQEMEKILGGWASAQKKVARLLAAALRHGGKDNITIVLIQCCG